MEHQSYGRVSQVFHLRGTMCFIYVELCVPSTWDSAFHLRGTLCFIYVELYVPPTWDDVSYTWSRAFHLLELCWNTTGAADEVGIGRVSLRVVPRL